jgi:hypothetical protein
MSAYKNCQFCGETIDANSLFCNHCKSALNQPAAPGSRPAPPPPAQPPRPAVPPPPVRSQGPGMPPEAPTPPVAPAVPPAPQAPVPPRVAAPSPAPPQAPVAPPFSAVPPVVPPAIHSVPAQPVPTTPPHQTVPTAAPAHYQSQQPVHKGSGGLIAIFLALLLLLGGGGTAVYFLFLKPAEPPAISSNLPADTSTGQQQVAQQTQTQTQQPAETQLVEQTQTQTVEQQVQSQPAENLTYFVITEPGSNLFIRKSPGRTNKTSDDVIIKVPRGTRLEVINRHGESIRIDGFIWWEIKDPATNIRGWVAAEYLSTNASDVQR